MEWGEMVKLTGTTSQYIQAVLDKGFSKARAIVVLLTPDDEALLKSDLDDSSDKTQLTGQLRPNVIFETGMAFGIHHDQTILIELIRSIQLATYQKCMLSDSMETVASHLKVL